jgi:hypothetical protein
MSQDRVRQNWGTSPNLAPTEKRTDPRTFLTSSLLVGLVVFVVVLWLLWRPLPFVSLPPGSLKSHGLLVLKTLVHAIFPNAFASDAQWYARFLTELPLAQQIGASLRIGLALCCSISPAFWIARIYLRPRDALMEIRGGHRFELGEGAAELSAAMKAIRHGIPDFEFAPGVHFPSQIWSQHVLAVGGVGAGKSTFMRPLLTRIVASNDRLLCFDPKGEFTAAFTKPIILAPWDARSYAWDIAADMRNHADMERFAAAVIKDSQDPMWSNAARGLLVGFLVYLQSSQGKDWGWQDLADMLTMPEEDILPLMQRYYPEAARAVSKASVTSSGILINLDAFCRPIFHLARAWGSTPKDRRISFVQWTKQANTPARKILLQGNGAYPELTRAYVEGIFSVISGIVNSVELDDDPKRKIWIVADEFAQMGKIPVRPLFEVGRSRGVRCIVACQDFAQLEEVHGKEGTRALISMCGTLMVGRVGPGETAETLSKNLGTREVERTNLSVSFDGKAGASGPTTTQTYSRDSLALYVPAELAARLGEKPHLKGCVFAVAVQGKTYEILWPYFTMPKRRKAHVPAPWTRGIPRTPEPAGAMEVIPAMHPKAAAQKATLNQPDVKQEATATQRTEPAFVPTADVEISSTTATPETQAQATPSTELAATPARPHRAEPFDSVVTIAEIGLSPHPTETATHLVLQAVELLRPSAGPVQRIKPADRPPGHSRS